MNEYWGKLRWCFDEGSNTYIVDDIGVIDVLDVPMEKSGKNCMIILAALRPVEAPAVPGADNYLY